jgi:hypothetical protein
MKHYLLVAGLILTIALPGCSSSKSPAQEARAAQEAALRQAIENRTFYLDVSRMIPMRGSTRALTPSYSVEIKKDQIKSNLPYFGRAYSIPYGGGDGLIFDAPISDYKVSRGKKKSTVIEVKTETVEDNYTYRIEIYPNGSAWISVSMQNRQAISFSGIASAEKPRR